MQKHHMAADVSHLNQRGFWDLLDMGIVPIASHSCARALCDHSRNLTDDMFLAVKNSGGVVGISMAALHLKENGNATISDVISHIEHYFSLGGEDTVALGCDFDGISSAPKEIQSMYDLPLLAEHLARLGYGDCQIEKLFYRNADRFLTAISGGK